MSNNLDKKSFEFPQRVLKVAKSDGAIKLYASIACIILSLIIGLIFLISLNPSRALPEFFTMLIGGLNYGGVNNFFAVLAKTAPLLCCGLSVLFAYRAGMFNIGVAGQYVLGVFGSLMFALNFNMPWYVCILMAIVCGAIWGAIPGLLKAYCNVNETLAGIMLNWIGLYFTNYSFQTYLSSAVNANDGYKTWTLAGRNPSALIPDLGLDSVFGSYFSISIFIAIIVCIFIWFLMKHTTFGYQLRASGLNKHATKYAGMNEKRNIILTLAISGGLAGLGASLYYLAGLEQWQAQWSNSLPQVPWNGIVVGFVAQLNPIGAIFSSFFICLISHGSRFMSQIYFPSEVADLVTAIIVYLCGLTNFAFILIQKYRNKLKKKQERSGIPSSDESTEISEDATNDDNENIENIETNEVVSENDLETSEGGNK